MPDISADRHFAAAPELVCDVVAVAAEVLFDHAAAHTPCSLRYRTKRGLYSPGAVVEVTTTSSDGGSLVRAVAEVAPSLLRRTSGERQRLGALFSSVQQVLDTEDGGEGTAEEAAEGTGAPSVRVPRTVLVTGCSGTG